MAIRPEKLKLSTERPEGATYTAQGKVENMAYLGERSHFQVGMDGVDGHIAVSSQNDRLGEQPLAMETPVWLQWENDALVVLGR